MKRRAFLKNTLFTSTGIFILPSLSHAMMLTEETDLASLDSNFIHPPDSSRPWCYYMWMNGNITKEGITLDLEAMKRIGIGGFICFNSAVGIPRGPVDYAGDVWMDATAHLASESQRIGLIMTLHNSPGYSGCGGPWITPEMSMQQLVWTETRAISNGLLDVTLARPYAKRNYYRDAYIVAYPSLVAEKALMKDKIINIWQNGKLIDKNILIDGNLETKIRLEVNNVNINADNTVPYDISSGTARDISKDNGYAKSAFVVFEFDEPFEARAITIYRKPEVPRDLFDGPRDIPPVFSLEYSDDNIQYRTIGNIRNPELRSMDTPSSLTFNAVKAKYYRLTTSSSSWLCEVELHNTPRLGGWPGKIGNTHGDSNGDTPGVSTELIIDSAKVIDVSGKMDHTGRLQWKAPTGNWTILRIGHTTTGEECAAQPDAGAGLQTDKFRKEALDFHFSEFLDKVFARVKPYMGKSFRSITVDSWEAGKQNWTMDFPAAFQQTHKYNIVKWMPAMTGRIVDSIDDTERFLWDVRKTQADLLSDNFYAYYMELCHQRGLEFYAEPYGDANFDSLQVSQYLDIPMSEFWSRYIYGSDIYSKQATSAAHVYGRKVAAAEAFTAMPATSKWTDYPYSLKAEGDYFFTLGINRLVFHTFVHQPYNTGFPAMTMGPFGIHIDRNNTWTEQAHGWTDHLKRSQYLLQHGLFVADVCYFKGDNPESGIPDVYRYLPQGYAGDVVGADALHKRFVINNGKIVLSDGMSYRLCMMAPLQNILPSSLNKLKELVRDGMTLVVSNKPLKAYGHASQDTEIQTIVNELYGDLNGQTVTEHRYGKGRIIWGKTLKTIFKENEINPDFEYSAENQDATIHYIHKHTDDFEFYFISNHRRRRENIVCSFRTKGRKPEIWNSEKGEIYEAVLFETENGRTVIPFELEPAGSLFVVFRKPDESKGFSVVTKDDKTILTTHSFNPAKTNLYADVQNNFTVTLWAKPDTYAQSGKSMLFHPPIGETVYGSGHAAMGLAAGQNAIRVSERSRGNAREVLSYSHPVEGWTHLGVVYSNGKPSLYVNGKLVAENGSSDNIVHPGMGTEPSSDQFSSYFEGNYTHPQLFKDVLTALQIEKLYAEGLPQPLLPTGIHLTKVRNQMKALIWQDGDYIISGNTQSQPLGQIKGCKILEINGSWKVKFSSPLPKLSDIVIPELISLHKHSDLNVKHFAGTATYMKTVVISKNELLPDKRLFLHLGRVEVVAEVKVNGKDFGVLWKEPFMIDITKAAKEGDNLLEIIVTNLWPNRLIGDEFLPEENQYTKDHNIKKLPDWYVNNQPKQGERLTFSTWKSYSKTDPLFESGLLGPVKLLVSVEKIFTI